MHKIIINYGLYDKYMKKIVSQFLKKTIFTMPQDFKPKEIQTGKKEKKFGVLFLFACFVLIIFFGWIIYQNFSKEKERIIIPEKKVQEENNANTNTNLPQGDLTEIKILEVYPEQSILKTIFENRQNDSEIKSLKTKLIVTSLKIEDFNQDFVLSFDGTTPLNNGIDFSSFDVIVFGFADCYSRKDLNENIVLKVKEFIEKGRGVIFSHDTICSQKNFTELKQYVGIKNCQGVGEHFQERNYLKVEQSDLIGKENLFEKPYILPKEFPIQGTHSIGGEFNLDDPLMKIWYKFSNGIAWLSSYKNIALIQTGDHTFNKVCQADNENINQGMPEKEEQKVIINLVYYLFNLNRNP